MLVGISFEVLNAIRNYMASIDLAYRRCTAVGPKVLKYKWRVHFFELGGGCKRHNQKFGINEQVLSWFTKIKSYRRA